eukprot:6388078-Amphidinium_carterae.1
MLELARNACHSILWVMWGFCQYHVGLLRLVRTMMPHGTRCCRHSRTEAGCASHSGLPLLGKPLLRAVIVTLNAAFQLSFSFD